MITKPGLAAVPAAGLLPGGRDGRAPGLNPGQARQPSDAAPTVRTAFLGTPEIAVPALRLLAKRTDLRLVITQPDRPAGRGNRLTPPAVKVAAQELGLPLWQPETTKGSGAAERLTSVDLAVVLAYGELLREPVLNAPRLGCVNLHGSLLPRWRGASPLQAAIRAGDSTTGMTVMRMVRALDAGPIFSLHPIPLPDDATLPWLHDRMADLAATALDHHLTEAETATAVPQDDSQATYCRKLTADDGKLDFTKSMAELDRWVRAYTPAPGCWVPLPGGQRLRILALKPRPGITAPLGERANEPRTLLIGCADGAVEITRLQSPGGSPLNSADWLNGHGWPLFELG
ncbi:methionyl-tRNA formyltransferase [Planctomycetota bacterium]|nr:methionyl-tRNA formyltransferase [Planctomycetota bacterium]